MLGKHSRAVLLSLAIALLLGLGGWWAATGQRPVSQVEQPSKATATQPAPTAAVNVAAQPAKSAADGTRQWIPGTLYRYEVTSDQQVNFRQSKPNEPAPPGMQFRIQGEWSVGVISVRDERIEARVHLRPDTFAMSVGGEQALQPETRRSMTAALGKPFFISLDRTGLVRFVHFEQNTDVLTQGLLRSLVASTQFVVSGKPGDTWDMEELDSTGKYQATYRRLAEDRFEKTKRVYSHLATPEGLVPPEKGMRVDLRSRATFELAEDVWARTLQAEESLEVDSGDGMPVVTNHLQLALRLLERRMDPSLLGALSARQGSLMTLPLASFLGQEQDPLAHYRQVLGDKRFEDMVRDLRSLPEEQKARDDARTAAMERLRALFMLEPEEARKVPDILRSGMTPESASPMIGALSAASTKEAIQSLVKTIDDSSLDPLIRTDAVAALGVAGEPTQEGVEALQRFTRDSNPMVRDTATLALGNAAMNMQDGDARGADALVREMQSAYRSATTPEQQAMVLRALGNTRAPSALPTLEEGLRSGVALVREAAVVALRNLAGPTVDRLITERLVGDPAPEVRKAAVFSCSFRPLAPMLTVFQQALQTDPAPAVRSDIVALLGAHRAALPLVDPLLLWASKNDRDADIRQAAATFLNSSARPLPNTP